MDDLRAQAIVWLEQEAPATEQAELAWTADMRYVGQSHEIETPLRPEWLDGDVAPLEDAFHSAHQRIFNHADLEAVPEMVNLRVRVVGVADRGRVSVSLGPSRQAPLIPNATQRVPGPHAWGEGSTAPTLSALREAIGDGDYPTANSNDRRPIAVNGAWHDATIHQRDNLSSGQRITGPAIVEQPDTTTVIPLGWVATVDGSGNLILERGTPR
jgi:N-methylhydantoinase A